MITFFLSFFLITLPFPKDTMNFILCFMDRRTRNWISLLSLLLVLNIEHQKSGYLFMHHSIINLTLTQWNTIKFPKKLATPSFRRSFHKNLININYGCEISGINTMNKHYIVIILLYCVYTNFIAFLSIYNYIYIYI